ncbi:uncharacterized protein METZ01_LOCUS177833 [marine metagenome]|uniref:Uncharacterized protein n=1 Tax=marine metagenome TaxID=408172 RepID=A0A382CGK1_9ZZZZ
MVIYLIDSKRVGKILDDRKSFPLE